jgi:hypothetical protein
MLSEIPPPKGRLPRVETERGEKRKREDEDIVQMNDCKGKKVKSDEKGKSNR